jgi:hypothetical protein
MNGSCPNILQRHNEARCIHIKAITLHLLFSQSGLPVKMSSLRVFGSLSYNLTVVVGCSYFFPKKGRLRWYGVLRKRADQRDLFQLAASATELAHCNLYTGV